MLEKHGPLYLNTPGTFVYVDIFKSPFKSSWGQGLVTVLRTFLHVRTLWWIQNCYINMFPSPHICLQLSVCLYWWLLARWSSRVCKDQRVCFQLFVGSMFFSGIRDYTVDTHTPIVMMSSLHLQLRLMMQRHFCLCLYYPQCTWKMIKSIW